MLRILKSPMSKLCMAFVPGDDCLSSAALVLFSDAYAPRPNNFLHSSIHLDAKAKGRLYYDLDTASNYFKRSLGPTAFRQQKLIANTLLSKLISRMSRSEKTFNMRLTVALIGGGWTT